MSLQAQTATKQPAFAAEVSQVTKVFYQKQPAQSPKDWLHPRKKTITALKDISFSIKTGEFTAYAGPNGAGKSTTIKLLCGMLSPQAGSISILGTNPQKDRIPLMRRLGILFGNRTELWWDHPVASSFQWKKTVYNIPESDFKQMEKLVVGLLDLSPFYQTFARELSLGQRMRADLGMMLLHRPEMILLDEPTLGLDVLAKRQMIDFLKTLNKQEGTTIVVTSHDMDDLEEMAQRILLISQGSLAFDGDFHALRDTLGLSRSAIIAYQDGTVKQLPCPDVKELMLTLSKEESISDIRFTQTSLEEGLANLYTTWTKGSALDKAP